MNLGVEAAYARHFQQRGKEGIVTMPRSKHKLGLLGGVFFLENNILLRRPRFLLTYSVALCVTYSNRKRRQRGVAKTKQCIFGQNRTEPKIFSSFKFSFPSNP